ncbi:MULTISPECIES: efflux RND transporter periplasmic adaptor subunit [Aliiglaciecola]|uniref:efflux RND transporter periplasmic adaptor subunit n=1 Tax=Aliiglaciecola TaxID=1406885 RepID=UPI001C0A2B01|nr:MULTISPECIES: efflux RND transporter periplasmic adaptor subunit [Aliiglaciecola]MBU2880280.1 efflux RND transporter periplasmic adaptor subunit [Aliiglaciecola lipolytica]MDO6712704.1 efflux RND transporter periplasmic adaptor subunit [Aliiglaciecola sp. 2_MG-2023]MDO6752911.1 efflux RND transporter periplasmic adaptor subunit [Aliiglaciecola sp. 1_MG-2023]
MNNTWIRALLFIGVVGLGIGAMIIIGASGKEEPAEEKVDTRPLVNIIPAESMNYQVLIHSFGEVTPLESTNLSAQVSGEVTSWNPKFVAGGLVKRGEVLFSIEKDTYEAALLQAEAEYTQAQAALIEEQARAEVAKQEAKNFPSSQVSDLYLRKPQVMSAQAALKSAQARMKIAQRDLDNCEVTAPYDALVIERSIGLGEYISSGTQAGTLNSIEAAEILFPIAGFDSAFLPTNLENQDAVVIIKGAKTFTRVGKIARDTGVIDQSTRMSHIVVRIDDPYGLKSQVPALKFGSYVEVNISGQVLENVYRLQQDLVTNKTVWVVDKDNRLQPKPVEIIREEGAHFILKSGLDNQDRVVTTIPEYPQKNMEVRLSSDPKDDDLVAQQPNQ